MKFIKWYSAYTVELGNKGNDYKYKEVEDVYEDDYELVLDSLYNLYIITGDGYEDYKSFYTIENISADLYRGASEEYYLTYCQPFEVELSDDEYADFLEWVDNIDDDYTPEELEDWLYNNGLDDEIIEHEIDFSAIIDDIREAWEEVRADREEE